MNGRTRIECPLLGLKRTCVSALHMSAFDPKRTSCPSCRIATLNVGCTHGLIRHKVTSLVAELGHWDIHCMFHARLKSLMKSVLPAKVFTTLRLARYKLLGAITKLKCSSMNGVRVNVGCGSNVTKGWVNLDVLVQPGILYWDCAKGLPFNDGTVEA